ncbi:MAG: flagellar biosynthesis protein flip [Gemmatimonadetes bacterium]|nr:flagellar biosynthesis protein flip [Gemmatimonadota bacterium]
MTFGSIMGVLLTLGFVLALLGVALKLLRRFAPTSTTNARMRMEVVQRLALGPKQGIAVIRVGERLVAVSVGEGGINRLFELEASELPQTVPDLVLTGERPTSPLDFKSAFRGALRNAGLAVVFMIALAASSGTAQGQVQGQAPRVTARPPTTSQLQQIAAQAVAGTRAGGSPAAVAQAILDAQSKNAKSGTTTAAASRSLLDAPVSKLAPQMDLKVGSGDGLHLSGTVGVVVMMGLMTLLPTLLLMMTGFTRILIVLNFLKQALGTQSAPPNQLVAALALLLTGFVMAPTLSEVNRTALTPWMDGKIDQAQMLDVGSRPFRAFMLRQTRRQDIETFVRMSGSVAPATINDVPMVTLTSAFVISELRTSFQIGFALFLPFIVIDIAVSSVLMSMGMFMLPPAMIALPFKLLLFVLVDGWSLIVQSLITSFR